MFTRTTLIAAAAAFGFISAANAGIFPIGSSLTLSGTNGPGGDYSDGTTFGATTTIDNGALDVSQTQTPDGPNAEWDVFNYSTVSGGPLAANITLSGTRWRGSMSASPPCSTPSRSNGP